MISDFEDLQYETEIKNFSRKHEVILIRIMNEDQFDENLPLGIMPEKGSESSKSFFSIYSMFSGKKKSLSKRISDVLDDLDRHLNIDVLTVKVGEDYMNKLGAFLKRRVRK